MVDIDSDSPAIGGIIEECGEKDETSGSAGDFESKNETTTKSVRVNHHDIGQHRGVQGQYQSGCGGLFIVEFLPRPRGRSHIAAILSHGCSPTMNLHHFVP
jgi:hypothetical protein